MNKLFTILLLFFCPFIAVSQLVELQKEGVLIVRLESGAKKLKIIESKITEGDLTDYWQQQLITTRLDIRNKNLALKKAFDESYQFSDLLYIYDTASVQLKHKSIKDDIFLNENLLPDASIQIGDRPFWVVSIARSNSGAEGFYVLDENLERVEKPLPSFVKFNTVFFLFNQLLTPQQALKKMYSQSAKRLNKKFNDYLRR